MPKLDRLMMISISPLEKNQIKEKIDNFAKIGLMMILISPLEKKSNQTKDR